MNSHKPVAFRHRPCNRWSYKTDFSQLGEVYGFLHTVTWGLFMRQDLESCSLTLFSLHLGVPPDNLSQSLVVGGGAGKLAEPSPGLALRVPGGLWGSPCAPHPAGVERRSWVMGKREKKTVEAELWERPSQAPPLTFL